MIIAIPVLFFAFISGYRVNFILPFTCADDHDLFHGAFKGTRCMHGCACREKQFVVCGQLCCSSAWFDLGTKYKKEAVCLMDSGMDIELKVNVWQAVHFTVVAW
jgi:hypothetical protein